MSKNHTRCPLRSTFQSGLLVSLLFTAADGVLLWALPRLNFSYGMFAPAFMGLSLIRLGLFFLWGLVLIRVMSAYKKTSLLVLAVVQVVITVCVVYGFYIEPSRITVTRIEVPVPGLMQPARIVQLSDIHVERTTRREQAIPGVVESLKPDLIVITGDFPNESYVNNPITRDDLRNLIRQLRAPMGVFGVNGNVDSVSNDAYLMQGLNIRLLNNEVARIPELGDHFAILGLSYVYNQHDRQQLEKLVEKTHPDDFTLLLYHKPDLIYTAASLGIDLYLAGHTHGGQVRLPLLGAVVTNSIHGKTFEMGEYAVGETTLFVSRGLGFTGGGAPRVRFLAPPEVAVIDLVPAR